MAPSKKENVRHAEKSRTFSTCSFADRVCQATKDKLREKAPEFLQFQLKETPFLDSLSPDEKQQLENNIIRDGENVFVGDKDFAYNLLFTGGQTVFAAVLLHEDEGDVLQCVSLGVGTKFLRDQLCDSTCRGSGGGFSQCSRDHDRVRDMHAEVLAKKGFMRYLAARFSCGDSRSRVGPAVLPAGQTLHFYVSSAPCGNSVIKKWAKPNLGNHYTDLKTNQWPGKEENNDSLNLNKSTNNPTLDTNNPRLNTNNPSLNANNSSSPSLNTNNSNNLMLNANNADNFATNQDITPQAELDTGNNINSIQTERETRKQMKRLRQQERNMKEQENGNISFIQPFHFTAKEEGQGAILCKGKTLSDAEKSTLNFNIPNATQIWQGKISGKKLKLCTSSDTEVEDCVPKQGPFTCSDKLLLWQHLGWQGSRLSHLVTNVSLSTVTVGRKFSLPHLERALFGRLNSKPVPRVGMKPVVCMVTKLKFDDNVLEDSDASFEDNRCYWWAKAEKSQEQMEVLNGSEGRMYGTGGRSLLVEGLEESGEMNSYAAEYKAKKGFMLDYLETLKPNLNKL